MMWKCSKPEEIYIIIKEEDDRDLDGCEETADPMLIKTEEICEDDVPMNFPVKIEDVSSELDDLSADEAKVKTLQVGNLETSENKLAVNNQYVPRPNPLISEKLKIHSYGSIIRKTKVLHNRSVYAHKCLICCRSFQGKSHLLHHVKVIHDKEKNYKCSKCDKCFGLKFGLTKHIISVHDKLKPHKCSVCNKSFGQKHYLSMHMKNVHKPLKCSFCECSFVEKHRLTIHTKSVHIKKSLHKCSVCSKLFRTLPGLFKHFQLYHEKLEQHKCLYCGSSVLHECSYTRHIKHVQVAQDKNDRSYSTDMQNFNTIATL